MILAFLLDNFRFRDGIALRSFQLPAERGQLLLRGKGLIMGDKSPKKEVKKKKKVKGTV